MNWLKWTECHLLDDRLGSGADVGAALPAFQNEDAVPERHGSLLRMADDAPRMHSATQQKSHGLLLAAEHHQLPSHRRRW